MSDEFLPKKMIYSMTHFLLSFRQMVAPPVTQPGFASKDRQLYGGGRVSWPVKRSSRVALFHVDMGWTFEKPMGYCDSLPFAGQMG